MRYSGDVAGVDRLVLTNLDVLRGFPLRIATSYALPGGERVTAMPAFDLERVEPDYVELPGFDEDITGVRAWDDLPSNARAYVEAIEQHTGLPVGTISVGPGREQVIVR